MIHYVLDGHDVVAVSPQEWCIQFEVRGWSVELDGTDPWCVARTELPGGAVVSTVFLGLDHNWWGHGPPLVFETMLFGAEVHTVPADSGLAPGLQYQADLGQWRWPTWELAAAGHEAIVALFASHDRQDQPPV